MEAQALHTVMDDKIKARIFDVVRHSSHIPESYTEDQCKDLEAELFHMVRSCVREELEDLISCEMPVETTNRALNRIGSIGYDLMS
jgi:hypothetical protein